MAYYTSETCGYINNKWVESGCTTDYAQSEVKYAVDAWKTAQAPAASEARLITYDELIDNLGYELGMLTPSEEGWVPSSSTPSFVYNSDYEYWTMSVCNDSASIVWYVYNDGGLYSGHVYNYNFLVVRPVIVISKSEL